MFGMHGKERILRPEWAKGPEKPRNPYRRALLYTVTTLVLFFFLYIFSALVGFHSVTLLPKARFLQELLPSLALVGIIAAWIFPRAKAAPSRGALLVLQSVPWLYGFGMFLVLH